MSVEKLKGIAIGLIASSVIFLLGVSAHASIGTFQLNASYSNIKIYVDGKLVDPKDVNGVRVEPFIVSGTTYLPVRAIYEALGKNVEWDGEEKAVYVGTFPTRLNPNKEQPTAESMLMKWVDSKGPDLGKLLEEVFGENSKVLIQAKSSQLILEIVADSKGFPDDVRQTKADAFLAASLGLGDDYTEMLELIRADTGFKEIDMQVWHYFDEVLVYTQELS